MLSPLDRAIRHGVFQPIVDRLGTNPQKAAGTLLAPAMALVIMATFGFAGYVEQIDVRRPDHGSMLIDMACLVVYGLMSALSMRFDVMRGPIGRDDLSHRVERLMTIPMAVSYPVLIVMVAPFATTVAMLLISMAAASQIMAFSIAYLAVCDKPPPPRTRTDTRLAGART